MQAIETIQKDGFTVRIYQDEDAASPADWDNLGTFVHWHKHYNLGNENLGDYDTPGHAAAERGGLRMYERYMRLCEDVVAMVPVGMLDHSGISLYAGGGSHWSDSAGWDSGTVGFMYTTRARIRELCGDPQVDTDPFYCPRTWPADGRSGPNWEGTAQEWVEEQLRGEIETWNQYVSGDVYGYVVEGPDGEDRDSCWGFYGFEYAKEEAVDALDGAIEDERDETAKINAVMAI